MRPIALSRSVLRTVIRRRISMTLTMARLKIVGLIMDRTVLMLRSEGQASTLKRCNRLINVCTSLTRLDTRCRALSTSRITSVRRTLRRSIMRVLILLKTSIVTNSVRLSTTLEILRLRRQYLARRTTTRRATYSECLTELILILRLLFCVNEGDINRVLYNEMKLSTRNARFVRAVTSSGLLFAGFRCIRFFRHCMFRDTGLIRAREGGGCAYVFPEYDLVSIYRDGRWGRYGPGRLSGSGTSHLAYSGADRYQRGTFRSGTGTVLRGRLHWAKDYVFVSAITPSTVVQRV